MKREDATQLLDSLRAPLNNFLEIFIDYLRSPMNTFPARTRTSRGEQRDPYGALFCREILRLVNDASRVTER